MVGAMSDFIDFLGKTRMAANGPVSAINDDTIFAGL